MEDNKNNGKKINAKKVIGIAASLIVVAGVACFAGYKAGWLNKENNAVISGTQSETGKKTTVGSNYTIRIEDVQGLYKFEDGVASFVLYLYKDGNFRYIRSSWFPLGEIGTYSINDKEIVLDVQYTTNSGAGLFVANKTIKLKINDDGSITDNNNLGLALLEENKNRDYSNVILKRASEEEDKEFIENNSTIPEFIKACKENGLIIDEGEQNSDETDKITEKVLAEIDGFLNKREVNGFVSHNFYNNAEEIDLAEVFYNYNCDSHDKYPGIDKELLKEMKFEDETLPTGFAVVSTEEIKNTYKKYTGKDISDKEIKNRLNYVYLEKYDVYCLMHGDTNQIPVKCVNGEKISNDTYVLTINYEGGMYYNDKEIKSSTLTLKKNGSSYIFVSNITK